MQPRGDEVAQYNSCCRAVLPVFILGYNQMFRPALEQTPTFIQSTEGSFSRGKEVSQRT